MPFTPGEPPRVRHTDPLLDDETIEGAIANAGTWGLVADHVSMSEAMNWVTQMRSEPRFEGFVVQTATRKAGEDGARSVWLKIVK